MAKPDLYQVIKGMILAPLGAPVLPVELDVSTESDVPSGLVNYYKYVPVLVGKAYSIYNTRELAVKHADILADFPDPSKMFYIGVADHKIRHQIGQNAFNQNMLGLNVGVPIANPMENLQMATMIDISTGDTYMEEDFVREETRFTFGGLGNFSVVFAVGCWDLGKIPMRHLEFVAASIAETYYQRIEAIRQTGTFSNADFKISVEMIKSAAEKNKERLTQLRTNLAFMPVTMG